MTTLMMMIYPTAETSAPPPARLPATIIPELRVWDQRTHGMAARRLLHKALARSYAQLLLVLYLQAHLKVLTRICLEVLLRTPAQRLSSIVMRSHRQAETLFQRLLVRSEARAAMWLQFKGRRAARITRPPT
jgi:hypothetical protein